MDFKKYCLKYQENDSSPWILIGDTVFTEVYDDVLTYWDTKGLKPGNYRIMLTLISDTPDGFSVDAQKSVNILSGIVGIMDSEFESGFSVSPNPASDYIEINPGNVILSEAKDLKIYNSLGECVINYELRITNYEMVRIDISKLQRGIYFLRIGDSVRKFNKI
jgi:hypothetical protein